MRQNDVHNKEMNKIKRSLHPSTKICEGMPKKPSSLAGRPEALKTKLVGSNPAKSFKNLSTNFKLGKS